MLQVLQVLQVDISWSFGRLDVVCLAGYDFQNPERYGAFEGHQDSRMWKTSRLEAVSEFTRVKTGQHCNPSC